jgi:hypothetical protein
LETTVNKADHCDISCPEFERRRTAILAADVRRLLAARNRGWPATIYLASSWVATSPGVVWGSQRAVFLFSGQGQLTEEKRR